jgi:hypothetical protein
MKWFLFFLLIPFSSVCQTVHMEDDQIVYKGSVKTNVSFDQFKNAVAQALEATKSKTITYDADSMANEIIVNAEMKLKSNQTFTKILQYRLKLKLKEGEYQYTIDSVVLRQKERGYATTNISSEQLIKMLDNTGPVASQAEKQMNEIDMRFQQLLDVLHNHTVGQ